MKAKQPAPPFTVWIVLVLWVGLLFVLHTGIDRPWQWQPSYCLTQKVK